MREHVASARGHRLTIGLVPTMGALHEGHGALMRRAREETGYVVVTIFVNPTQFNRPDDFEKYPRDLATDLAFCERLGVDAVFAPDAKEMYPGRDLWLLSRSPAFRRGWKANSALATFAA